MKEPTDHEMDMIYGYIDDLHLQGQFQVTDAILKTIDIRKVHPTLLISYLTISWPARNKLKEYDDFFNKVEEYFKEIGIDDHELLSRLK